MGSVGAVAGRGRGDDDCAGEAGRTGDGEGEAGVVDGTGARLAGCAGLNYRPAQPRPVHGEDIAHRGRGVVEARWMAGELCR